PASYCFRCSERKKGGPTWAALFLHPSQLFSHKAEYHPNQDGQPHADGCKYRGVWNDHQKSKIQCDGEFRRTDGIHGDRESHAPHLRIIGERIMVYNMAPYTERDEQWYPPCSEHPVEQGEAFDEHA